MIIFFEEVMLGDEDVVVPELIGELNLFQRFVVDVKLLVRPPLVRVERSGCLPLDHQTAFQDHPALLKATVSTRNPRSSEHGLVSLIHAAAVAVNHCGRRVGSIEISTRFCRLATTNHPPALAAGASSPIGVTSTPLKHS
jgi:hypothetical protein